MSKHIPDYAIEIENLNKIYAGNKKQEPKQALDNVSLRVKRGAIFGLLGPNGAGKSSLINIMAGLVIKTSGMVKIWNYDIDKNPRNAKASIGIVPQEVNTDAFFTPRQSLELQAGLYGVKKADQRTDDILRIINLEDKADSHARRLSGGMKRRLMVGKAMVHAPPILVLDEPTAGVDVDLRQQLWSNIRALNDQGVTILLTTHYLEEAQELCDTIAIINHGKVITCEPTATLLARVDNKEITFRLDRDISILPGTFDPVYAQMVDSRHLKIRYTPNEQSVGSLIEKIQLEGLGIVDISTDESDLEDVFLQLTKGS